MKKIYTLVAMASLSLVSFSQEFDLSISWETLVGGDTYDSSPIDGSFYVTNEGDETIPAGDTIYVGYTIGGTAVRDNDLSTAGASAYILSEDFPAASAIGLFGINGITAPTGFTSEFCAVVWGMGSSSLAGDFALDANPEDNTICVSLDIVNGSDASVNEVLNDIVSNVYVANGQLNIVNNTTSSNTVANVNIVNISGQIVQAENITLQDGTTLVELNNLANGIYIVSIEAEGAIVTRKVSVR